MLQSLQGPSLEFDCGDETKAGVTIAHGFCGHVFHLDEINKWLESHDNCPQCSCKWELTHTEPVVGYADWEGSA